MFCIRSLFAFCQSRDDALDSPIGSQAPTPVRAAAQRVTPSAQSAIAASQASSHVLVSSPSLSRAVVVSPSRSLAVSPLSTPRANHSSNNGSLSRLVIELSPTSSPRSLASFAPVSNSPVATATARAASTLNDEDGFTFSAADLAVLTQVYKEKPAEGQAFMSNLQAKVQSSYYDYCI